MTDKQTREENLMNIVPEQAKSGERHYTHHCRSE